MNREKLRDVDIVIAVFDQLHYTQRCLETLYATVPPDVNIFLIDNGSTDGTPAYLAKQTRISVITNERNRGCAAAWNQGVKAGTSSWVVIVNNDIIFPQGWLEGLLGFAEGSEKDIVSPGVREGECNYDISSYATGFMTSMADVKREADAYGACFMVRRKVFDTIGYFDEGFNIGGGEDSDFFLRSKQSGFSLAITGSSFLHHFGCVTQNHIKVNVLGRSYGPEHRVYFRRKWRLSYGKRCALRLKRKLTTCWRASREHSRCGHSLQEKWDGRRLRYC